VVVGVDLPLAAGVGPGLAELYVIKTLKEFLAPKTEATEFYNRPLSGICARISKPQPPSFASGMSTRPQMAVWVRIAASDKRAQ